MTRFYGPVHGVALVPSVTLFVCLLSCFLAHFRPFHRPLRREWLVCFSSAYFLLYGIIVIIVIVTIFILVIITSIFIFVFISSLLILTVIIIVINSDESSVTSHVLPFTCHHQSSSQSKEKRKSSFRSYLVMISRKGEKKVENKTSVVCFKAPGQRWVLCFGKSRKPRSDSLYIRVIARNLV